MKKLFLEISICGAPNVGKSTFLNAIMKKKLSIVSSKPQTTRVPTMGIYDDKKIQIHFTDSPGAFKSRQGYSLEKAISKQAWGVIASSENVMLFVDGMRGVCQNTNYIIQSLQKEKKSNAIAVITKADIASAKQKLELAKTLDDFQVFDEIYMISAKSGAGVESLMAYLTSIAKEEEVEEYDFEIENPEDFAAEIVREIIFENLQKELPYSCKIETTSFVETDDSIEICQDIFVTRESHKIILIGKRGAKIKEIGTLAIDELEKIFKKNVMLSLECRIDEKWRENFERSVM